MKHSVGELVSQRVYGLALGYEDLNDHEQLRQDPLLRVLAGKRDLEETILKINLEAVNEVRPPIIVATLVVMVSFLPMLFITGMMGPYMRPMALNVPVAMFMSMVV